MLDSILNNIRASRSYFYGGNACQVTSFIRLLNTAPYSIQKMPCQN